MLYNHLYCLESNLLTTNRNLHFIYKKVALFKTIVSNIRIILSKIFSELKFFLVLRRKRCVGIMLSKIQRTDILFWLQRAKRPRLLRPMLVSELTEKPPGRRREAKERRVTSVGLAPDTLIRPSTAWHVTMGFPAEIFSWK